MIAKINAIFYLRNSLQNQMFIFVK